MDDMKLEYEKLCNLLRELQRRFEEIDIRLKTLEKENKDTQFNNQ